MQVIEEHYKEHYKSFAKKAGAILHDHHLGEDCAQEAYERAVKYFSSFDEKRGDFNSWFTRIFYNRVRHYQEFIRGKGVVKETKLTDFEVPMPEILEIHKDLIAKEIVEYGYEYQREVLYLHLIIGYKTQEISEMLDMEASAVRKTISRFSQYLRGKHAPRKKFR